MELMQAIEGRRSIRRFSSEPVTRAAVERILQAGIEAPSAKNRQPWRFIVITGAAREEMVRTMLQGIERMESMLPPEVAGFLKWAKVTARIMRDAPVTVMVMEPETNGLPLPGEPVDQFMTIYNAQSQGAALQNMSLAALEEGLGSLWIGDISFAYDELRAWLGTEEHLAAAFSIGHPLESPARRPRKALADIITWREE